MPEVGPGTLIHVLLMGKRGALMDFVTCWIKITVIFVHWVTWPCALGPGLNPVLGVLPLAASLSCILSDLSKDTQLTGDAGGLLGRRRLENSGIAIVASQQTLSDKPYLVLGMQSSSLAFPWSGFTPEVIRCSGMFASTGYVHMHL